MNGLIDINILQIYLSIYICMGWLAKCSFKGKELVYLGSGHILMVGRSPSGFSVWEHISRFHQLQQIIHLLKHQSSPQLSHHHHHAWPLYEDVLNVSFMPHLTGLQLLSTEYFPKGLGDHRDVFFSKCETSCPVLFGQQWFSHVTCHIWVIAESWGKGGLQCFLW